jgi:DNA-binding transcriptional MocR family regulator
VVITVNLEQSGVQTGGGPAGAIPFIYGHVDPSLFPVERMRVAADEALRDYGPVALNYGVERGCAPLLAHLQTKLARDEGLLVRDDSLMLTGGASGGLDAICRLFARPGDTVLVEAPTYHEALILIRDHPVQVATVELDSDGLNVDALAERLQELTALGARPRLLYTIPSFQNPSGVTLSFERRPMVLELARQYNLLIVEDDVYRDLAFETNPPTSLYSLDAKNGGSRVMRLGSFSKNLAPGLRLGWLMAAPAHVARLCASGLITSGGGANPFAAFVAAAFCRHGWLEAHIHQLTEAYQHRRDAMLAALSASMPATVRWTLPGGGFYVWLTLPAPLIAEDVLSVAHQNSITFFTGKPFFANGGGERNIRLPYSYIPIEEMEEGIHTLGKIIRDMLEDPKRTNPG